VDPKSALARLHIEERLDPLSILQVARVCEQALAARSAIQPERMLFLCCGKLFPACRPNSTACGTGYHKIIRAVRLMIVQPELAQYVIHRSTRSHITRSLET